MRIIGLWLISGFPIWSANCAPVKLSHKLGIDLWLHGGDPRGPIRSLCVVGVRESIASADSGLMTHVPICRVRDQGLQTSLDNARLG